MLPLDGKAARQLEQQWSRQGPEIAPVHLDIQRPGPSDGPFRTIPGEIDLRSEDKPDEGPNAPDGPPPHPAPLPHCFTFRYYPGFKHTAPILSEGTSVQTCFILLSSCA